MPFELVEDNGFLRFARNAGDQMGFEGMAEIYMCMACQFPELSRANPPAKAIYEIRKKIFQLMRKHKFNKWEMCFILDCLLYPDQYEHY